MDFLRDFCKVTDYFCAGVVGVCYEAAAILLRTCSYACCQGV